MAFPYLGCHCLSKNLFSGENGPGIFFGHAKLHVFEWDMGHWPILRAHHHFGPGLSLILICNAIYLTVLCGVYLCN